MIKLSTRLPIARQCREVDAKSQFNVASIRKTYLGFAISLALYEGKIKSLNDYVFDYLEDLDQRLFIGTTIRHLLTHTHGLNGPLKRIFSAGTDWQYNNTGVNLLIRLVQKVFGRSLAEVIEDQILNPCGFTETGWRKEENEQNTKRMYSAPIKNQEYLTSKV
ncbi:serine hydrolase domain-containing protein [Paenibacillus sp. MMO-58]|uniref:serine hydrolase domain-containing protein n=1 Tax=Paenibacillus sp. MMO-58 TaxID=3081290 RepID=UPI00301AF45D